MINKVDSGAAIKPAQKKGLQGAFYALPRMATFSPLEREEHIIMWGASIRVQADGFRRLGRGEIVGVGWAPGR